MSIDTKRLREIKQNHADCARHFPDMRSGWLYDAQHDRADLLDEIDRLQGIANAFEIVKEQRDSAEAKLAMVQRLKCHRCEGRGRHYHDGICELCMGSGLRVPELEDDNG